MTLQGTARAMRNGLEVSCYMAVPTHTLKHHWRLLSRKWRLLYPETGDLGEELWGNVHGPRIALPGNKFPCSQTGYESRSQLFPAYPVLKTARPPDGCTCGWMAERYIFSRWQTARQTRSALPAEAGDSSHSERLPRTPSTLQYCRCMSRRLQHDRERPQVP